MVFPCVHSVGELPGVLVQVVVDGFDFQIFFRRLVEQKAVGHSPQNV